MRYSFSATSVGTRSAPEGSGAALSAIQARFLALSKAFLTLPTALPRKVKIGPWSLTPSP